MERLVFLLIVVLGVYFLTQYNELHTSPLSFRRLLGAPSPNTKLNLEGALGVFLNQGKQSINLTPTDITVGVNSSQLMILNSAGNVGIGVTAPTQKLHINPGRVLLGGNTSAIFFNDTNRGIMYSKTPNGQQTFTSNAPKDGLALYGYLDGCLGTTDIATGGSKSVLTWTSHGAVTINPPSSTSVNYPLAVYGYSNVARGSSYIYMNDPATSGAGDFRASIYAQFGVVSGSYGFMTLSDQRIKKNIQRCEEALGVIQSIEVVSYEHIDQDKQKRVEYGVVAQQLQQCMPSAVHRTSDWLPNVYQKVSGQILSTNTVHLFFQERVPDVVGGLLRLLRVDGKELSVRVLDQGSHSLVVEEYGIDGEVFAYGTLVNDFLVVEKSQLGVLALQGVKELVVKYQKLEERLARLESLMAK
jgi:hypothetical protein